MRFCDDFGNELTAADVLSPEELAEYHEYKAATRVRHPRPRFYSSPPDEDTVQDMYDRWVYGEPA